MVVELKESDISAEQITDTLTRLRVMPVVNAHPTEALRRTMLTKEQRIARALVDRIDPDRLTVSEDEAALGAAAGLDEAEEGPGIWASIAVCTSASLMIDSPRWRAQ